jgi:hypothetical protein
MTLPETPTLVFVCGAPRSGGAVTHASFDSHPDVLAWPYEFFYFMFFQGVSGGRPKASIRRLNEELERDFRKKMPKMLTKSRFASEAAAIDSLDDLRAGPFSYPEFLAAINSLEEREVDSLEYLYLLFACLKQADAVYRDRDVKYFLVCTTARGMDWSNRELLRRSYFLFTSREAESSYTSLRDKYQRTKGTNLCAFLSIFGKRSALYWIETFRRISRYVEPTVGKENFIVVPLKRLQYEPDAVLSDLCKYLGIEATPSVFELTFFGEPYFGNANQKDFNDGRIAKKPSATRVPLCNFERRIFAALGLYDFDAERPRERVPLAPWEALSLAFRGAFREIDREHIWADPKAPFLKILAGRAWIFVNLCALYGILKSENLCYRVVGLANRRHVRDTPIWKSPAALAVDRPQKRSA